MKKGYKKVEKVSAEVLELQNLERSLKEYREDRYISIPPDYVKYEVGQQVAMGNIKKSIVTEVLDGGKIDKLHQYCTDNYYGKMIDSERDIYVAWMDICPYHTNEELKSMCNFSQKDNLRLSFSQTGMSSIFSKVYHFGLDMNPDYQRGNVWDMEDKKKLIASVFMNVDIGKFVFIHLPYKDHSPSYEILDGKQRVTALTEFYESRFKFGGKYYKDLSYADQSHFENHPISCADLLEDNVKPSDKYLYFLRLNTGGRIQDPEHIKHVETLYKQALKEEQC